MKNQILSGMSMDRLVMVVMALVVATAARGQFAESSPKVLGNFTELRDQVDAAWTDMGSVEVFPIGLSFTNALPVFAVANGFDAAFLAGLRETRTVNGVALRIGSVRETAGTAPDRRWYGAGATPLAVTPLPQGYNPLAWVLDRFPPPGNIAGLALEDYVSERRLNRQVMTYALISEEDVPAYLAERASRVAAMPSGPFNDDDLVMSGTTYDPVGKVMRVLLVAPSYAGKLGVFETKDIRSPLPWALVASLSNTGGVAEFVYPDPPEHGVFRLSNLGTDSDLDGISDAVETLVLGTNAHAWDSARDGISDRDRMFRLDGATGEGGLPLQVSEGLGLSEQDMSNVVSGPVEIRGKGWRTDRAKNGWRGFVDARTKFLGLEHYQEYGPMIQNTRYFGNTESSSLRFEKNDQVLVDEVLQDVTGAGELTPLDDEWHWWHYDSSMQWYSEYTLSNTEYGTGGHSWSRLSRPYTDRMLAALAAGDLAELREEGMPDPGWDHMIFLKRPADWGLLPGSTDCGYLFQPETKPFAIPPSGRPVEESAFRLPKVLTKPGQPDLLGGIELQAIAWQATSAQPIPSGYLQRGVVLEVHRGSPPAVLVEGPVTRVTPREVFLKPTSTGGESVVFTLPPPSEAGSVAVVDGGGDIHLTYVGEEHEETPGDRVCTGIPVAFSVRGSAPSLGGFVEYRLWLERPDGSRAQIQTGSNSTVIASGSVVATPLAMDARITPDVPGQFILRLEVSEAGGSPESAPRLLVDRAVIHAFPTPTLCADYNRDGMIDAVDAQIRDTPFGPNQEPRRWIIWSNDDDDAGDDALNSARDNASLDDLPFPLAEAGNALERQPDRLRDYAKVGKAQYSRVPGPAIRDWVDYFPLHATFPRSDFSDPRYAYRISTDFGDGIRFAFSTLRTNEVGALHTSMRAHALECEYAFALGDPGPYFFHHAAVDSIATRQGLLIPDWLDQYHGVLFLCGAEQGSGSLSVQITDTSMEPPRVVGRAAIPFQVASVTNMFRYINIRESSDLYRAGSATAVESPNPDLQKPAVTGPMRTSVSVPAALPDGYYRLNDETPLRTIVATHGVDWDEDETPAGMVEVFKRLHQSGSNARFVGVSWPSNMGREQLDTLFGYITIAPPGPLDYYEDVIGAFVAAKHMAAALKQHGLDGENTVLLAHSLGNMVACSMIQDHGLQVGTYMLLNAAVPVEALLPAGPLAGDLGMVPEEWKNDAGDAWRYHARTAASNWYRLFAGHDDPRSALKWQGRFADVAARTRCINYYSSGEEVLRSDLQVLHGLMPDLLDLWGLIPFVPDDPNSVRQHEFVWVRQEMQKGNIPGVADYGGILGGFLDDHGGWGDPGGGRNAAARAQSENIPPEELISTPFFRRFQNTDPAPTGLWLNAQDWLYHPAGSDLAHLLPTPPFNANTPDGMIYRHGKLLAEAIPALSTPAGGSLVGWRALSDDSNVDLHGSAMIRQLNREGDPILWPAADQGGRDGKPRRWLHGDYKDAAYLYVKGLYDHIVNEGGLR